MSMDNDNKAKTNPTNNDDPNSKSNMGNDKLTPPRPGPVKKRRGMSLLRAVLLVLRRPSKKIPIHLDVAETGSLLAAMRPLHHQPKLQHRTPPPLLEVPPPGVDPPADSPETPRVREKEVFLPPPSPCGSEGWFSTDGMSRYASAEDLRALDTCSGDEGEIEEADGTGDGTPNAIDLKAEEFIAMFYAQMRQQRMESMG